MSKVVVMSDLYCEECGSLMSIPRKKSKRREEGHVKHMWCYKCKCITGHIEKVKASINAKKEVYIEAKIKKLKENGNFDILKLIDFFYIELLKKKDNEYDKYYLKLEFENIRNEEDLVDLILREDCDYEVIDSIICNT